MLVLAGLSVLVCRAEEYIERCIVGAGPAGLQLGHFFQKHAQPYVILEREASAGCSFAFLPGLPSRPEH